MKTPLSNLEFFGAWNPQFLREVKGRLKPKNIIASIAASLVGQLVIVISLLGKLPDSSAELAQNLVKPAKQYSRYCIDGANYLDPKSHYRFKPLLCQQDLLNHWLINWQVFWWDVFFILSLIGIGLLLVLGTYFLINNSLSENKQETLNLVRLSPQSANEIFLGKILGVPILLYLGIAAAFPLHFVAAMQAGINLGALIGFYFAVIASCAFFYSLGLLISFVFPKVIVSWLTVGVMIFFLYFTSILSTYIREPNSKLVLDWLLIFNPNNLLLSLGKTTVIPHQYFDMSDVSLYRGSYNPNELNPFFFDRVLFYGQAFGRQIGVAIGLVIANFSLWTYWIWQGLSRRYYNPHNSIVTKKQSYWITGLFVSVGLGFAVQDVTRYRYEDNFLISMCLLQFALIIYFIGLIFALSPQRQTLHDWARYRHQEGKVSLWSELIFGDRSPAVIALLLNVVIAVLFLIPSFIMFIPERGYSKSFGLVAVVLSVIAISGTVIFYATLSQLILLNKSKNRVIITLGILVCLTVGFPIGLGLLNHNGEPLLAWLFTPIPFVVFVDTYRSSQEVLMCILGQWLAITVVSGQIYRNLRLAGRSETYELLKEVNPSS